MPGALGQAGRAPIRARVGSLRACFRWSGPCTATASATLNATDSNFGPAVVAATGSGPYDKTATRWGDYSFAVPDSSADNAWLATEYIPPKSSQTTTGLANWGTRVLDVPLP